MNKKAISTLTFIILIGVSAIVGGIISYMLTIAYYVEVGYNLPENETALIITNVYINPEDASSFMITVLNPSFSVSSATITGVAISVNESKELYEAITIPPMIEGLNVPRGRTLDIKCSAVRMGEKRLNWEEFAYEFAGQAITIHVFSKEASASNRRVKLPYVKLHVSPDFKPEETFERFEVTLKNDENSEANLTIREISLVETKVNCTVRQFPPQLIPTNVTPSLPCPLAPGDSRVFTCKLNWLGVYETKLMITTEEGYKIYEKFELPQTYATVENVIFNESDTEHFKIIAKNHLGSAGKVTVTNITCSFDNGTVRQVSEVTPALPKDIAPASSLTFTCAWDWLEYRGRNVTITLHLSQGFNVSTTKTTPGPIVLEVLNRNETFNLRDHEHFNITLFNHPLSLEALNITKIEVNHSVLKGNLTNPELPLHSYLNPGETLSIYCNYTWSADAEAGKNLTITVYTVTNETKKEYQFEFTFMLPKAELNVTSVKFIESEPLNYLNITVTNMPYSIVNLTITKIAVSIENETQVYMKQWSPGLIVLMPGENCNINFEVNESLLNVNITVTITTKEGIECVWSGIPLIGNS